MVREPSTANKITSSIIISVLVPLLLSACNPGQKASEVPGMDELQSIASNTPTSTSIPVTTFTPTNTAIPAATTKPTRIPAPGNTLVPTLTPTLTPWPRAEDEFVPAPPGLILNDRYGVYRVGADGSLLQVTHRLDAVISPEGDRALYFNNSENDTYELYMIDLNSGAETNLSNTPDREEDSWAFWWPERPGTIIFGSREVDKLFYVERYLTSISSDGTNYRLLGDGIVIGPEPALSPDGQTLAITIDLHPYLYDMESGAQPLELETFGLAGFEDVRFYGSSWSPDGRKVVWCIRLTANGKTHDAYAILDLVSGESTLVHPYDQEGVGSYPSVPVWSPDGGWLALSVWQAGLKPQIWVMRVDGSEEIHLGEGNRPTWNPAGGQIVFYTVTDGRNIDGIWLVEVGEWTPRPLSLPVGLWINDWMEAE